MHIAKQIFPSLLFVLLVLYTGCETAKYPGYSKKSEGIYYQLLTLGDSVNTPSPGDYVTVDLVYATIDDSVFFEGRRKFRLSEPAFQGSVDECLGMLSKQESAKFIIDAHKFFTLTLESTLPSFIDSGSPMKVQIEMLDIQSENEYQKEKEAFVKWIEDFGDYEQVILKQYLKNSELPVENLTNGLYYLNLRSGNGKKVEKGDTVIVHYEGRFLNGKFFDSTIKRKEPFGFVYGQEWQVIEGMEQAIGLMEEGEKSLFIMPSDVAFGKSGSSTGIIPPYTSIIFEVELIEVKKGKV